MFQTVLLFLAPAQGMTARSLSSPGAATRASVACPGRAGKAVTRMATRSRTGPQPQWSWRTCGLLSVAANALGFMLLMAGLGMVMRLAEVLLS